MKCVKYIIIPTRLQGITLFVLLLPIVMFCSESVESDLSSLSARIDETDMYFEVTGLGAAAVDDGTTIAEARRNAESIAYIQAVEILAEAIQGIAVQGEIRLRDLAMQEGRLSQLIKVRLEQIRQVGATQFEEQDDGSWIAASTIIYQKENAQKIADAIGLGEYDELTLYTENTVLLQNRDYSGIILDVRYVSGFNTFLAPKVARNDGSVLFSVRDIAPRVDRNIWHSCFCDHFGCSAAWRCRADSLKNCSGGF